MRRGWGLSSLFVFVACGATAAPPPAVPPVPIAPAGPIPSFAMGEMQIPSLPMLDPPRSAALDEAYAAFRRMLALSPPGPAPADGPGAAAWVMGPLMAWMAGMASAAEALAACAQRLDDGNVDEQVTLLALMGLLQERLVRELERLPPAMLASIRQRMSEEAEGDPMLVARDAYAQCVTPGDPRLQTQLASRRCDRPAAPRVGQLCAWQALCRERLAIVERTLGPEVAPEPTFEMPDERFAGPSPGGPDECWAYPIRAPNAASEREVEVMPGRPTVEPPPPSVAVVFDDDYTSAPLMAAERRALRDLVRDRLASTLSASVLPIAEVDSLLASQAARSIGARRCQAMPAFVDVLAAARPSPWLAVVFGECQSALGPCALGVTFWSPDAAVRPEGLPEGLRAAVRGASTDVSAFRSAVGMLQPIGLGGGGGGAPMIGTPFSVGITVLGHGAWGEVDPRPTLERARQSFRSCGSLSPFVWSDVVLEVRPDGRIAEVLVEPIGELPDPRASCIVQAFEGIRYPRGAGTRRALARIIFGPSQATDRDHAYGRYVWGTDVRVRTRDLVAEDAWVRRTPHTTSQQMRRIAASCYSASFPAPERGVVSLTWRHQVTAEGATREPSATIVVSPDPARSSALQRCIEQELARLSWPCTSTGGATSASAALCMFRD